MELEAIYELMERFSRSSLSKLELCMEQTSIKLEKGGVSVAAAAPVALAAAAPVQEEPAQEAVYIKAPLVGTFYAASAPGEAPMVRVGDRVERGDAVCILEAMKTMSQVPAPFACVIEEVLLQDGELAAFDAPIFRVRAV